jgi:hypothetical protein
LTAALIALVIRRFWLAIVSRVTSF